MLAMLAGKDGGCGEAIELIGLPAFHSEDDDFVLVLAKESLEGFEIARRKSFEQLHAPLSIRYY